MFPESADGRSASEAGRFVAQHHGSAVQIGYFTSLQDAQAALDEVDDGSWQGIRNMASGERWWRQGGPWIGPRRMYG
jgi:hypothetical protein